MTAPTYSDIAKSAARAQEGNFTYSSTLYYGEPAKQVEWRDVTVYGQKVRLTEGSIVGLSEDQIKRIAIIKLWRAKMKAQEDRKTLLSGKVRQFQLQDQMYAMQARVQNQWMAEVEARPLPAVAPVRPAGFWRSMWNYLVGYFGPTEPKRRNRTILIPRDRFMSIAAARRSFAGYR